MNFHHDESVPHIQIWYTADPDLIELFDSEFEDIFDDVYPLRNSLDRLFQKRVDNFLEEPPMMPDARPFPYVSYCDEQELALVHELVGESEKEMWYVIELESKGDFLAKVLDWLSDDVDVSPVIDSIEGLVDVLNEYESEYL